MFLAGVETFPSTSLRAQRLYASRGQTALVFEGKHRRRALRVPHYRLASELDDATTTRKPILLFQLSGLLLLRTALRALS